MVGADFNVQSNSELRYAKDAAAVEYFQQWSAIERLPIFEGLRSSLFDNDRGKQVIDITKLGSLERHIFVEKLIKHIQNDNLQSLRNIRTRIDKAVDEQVAKSTCFSWMVLILLKPGGHVIYSGSLGENSSNVIEYFEGISGVPKIRKNHNPASWILEVTSPSTEAELGVDFAQIYKGSAFFERSQELVRQLSTPPPGSIELNFPTLFAQNGWEQFKSCLWKQNLSYWRNPSYNLTRITHALVTSLIFGILFRGQGKKLNDQQDVFNVVGSVHASMIFMAINNCQAVLPHVARERSVMYRERFAGMYSAWAYAFALVVVEVPYILVQSVGYVIVAYSLIGYYRSAYKVLWYFYAIFSALLCYNYMGMALISLTPNFIVATIFASMFFRLTNIFSGLTIPQPQIPRWWIWLYYLVPTSWTLKGLLASQYGDIHQEIVALGERTTVDSFLNDHYGFRRLAMIS
ncbi:hypothetical protein SLEP1_g5094 [Rubroshorea leprosula]|uniref:ABC-2 type transporter transmembrane domain-containing protein n=1 Tax=Rubroshorea leprosula TaxID=152421 RepID=A0AAV5HZ00_9ROSI|nr:hypothetical protein SLEP1_g5094 [Rubroshorea leprosula]